MKVLIVGAGAQGHVITWNLARCPAVSEIVLGDIDEARARAVADQVGGVKPKQSPSTRATWRRSKPARRVPSW